MSTSPPQPNAPSAHHGAPVDTRSVARLWWPLAASWMLMAAELPLVTATVARMSDAERNLAAYSSLVFPIALAIEAPIIMLLAASTALCVDWASYLKLRRFMLAMAASLTVLHVVVAFTPLFDLVALHLIQAPAEVLEPGRIGLRIMTPWTAAIAYRRFQQGVMIRFGRSRAVGAGTLVRLLANVVVLGVGYSVGNLSGIVVATCAVACGVVGEALFARACVQPILRDQLRHAPPAPRALSRAAFVHFYAPLALTPLVTLLAQPIGAAAMSRMSNPMATLAAWPAVHGLLFFVRSAGLAFNEVVIALIAQAGSLASLRRFTRLLATATTVVLAAIALSPLSELWFRGWCGLQPELARVGGSALLFALLMPAMSVVQSYYQGALVQRRLTRAVTESVVLSLAVTTLGLVVCVQSSRIPGLTAAVSMLTLGNIAQSAWLWWRSRGVLLEIARTGAADPR